jgi:hypothetical protein
MKYMPTKAPTTITEPVFLASIVPVAYGTILWDTCSSHRDGTGASVRLYVLQPRSTLNQNEYIGKLRKQM